MKAAKTPKAGSYPRRARSGGGDVGHDAVWRDLAGAGSSKVGLSGALRARDVDRPTAEDLAEAQREVVIVRREPPAQPNQAPASPTGRSKAGGKPNAAATGDAPSRRPRRRR